MSQRRNSIGNCLNVNKFFYSLSNFKERTKFRWNYRNTFNIQTKPVCRSSFAFATITFCLFLKALFIPQRSANKGIISQHTFADYSWNARGQEERTCRCDLFRQLPFNPEHDHASPPERFSCWRKIRDSSRR